MGCANSKTETNDALRLCRGRRRFIKQAINSRYALAAAHVAYTKSLRNIGVSLRRYAEAEVLIESSLSTSATDPDKSPSHCSYLSPSPSHNVDISDSPLHNENPLSLPQPSRMSYMRTGGNAVVTVSVSPSSTGFGNHESMTFPMPPPPPHPDSGSWDFFDTSDDIHSFGNVGHNGLNENSNTIAEWRHYRSEIADCNETDRNNEVHEGSFRPQIDHKKSENSGASANQNGYQGRLVVAEADSAGGEVTPTCVKSNANGSAGALACKAMNSKRDNKTDEDLCAEREDPSEFITHRAKDFLSSIKDIEHRFFRASESGKEVSRLFEANKIRVGYSEARGSSRSAFSIAFHLICCRGKSALVFSEPTQNVTKVITWNRTTSSRSSSSKNPLATTYKDDNDDSGSDFNEEFCMIAGSHSSTLDRLYAWERKLYDEVKASESISKVYDRKCDKLRHQFAKDLSTQTIDKTRSAVKDLHSRIRVGLHSVDSISKRIEKMRDEELQPQLLELIQGLTRMWKAMLECHHAQYITISLAYHARTSTGTVHGGDSQKQIMTLLYNEIECFGLSFADWIKSHTLYVEALNGWIQNCILQPRERSKSRRPFSPRRVLAPPIFVIVRDWSAGIKSLPSEELSVAIKNLLSDLRYLMSQHAELHLQKKHEASIPKNSEENTESKDEVKNDDDHSNLSFIHTSLTKVLDRLTKLSEASFKMYEDVRQKSEVARIAYANCRPPRF